MPLCCHAPVSKESTQHQSLAMSSALRYYILPVQGAGPRICSTTISRPPSIPMNRSDPTAHEDHFNLPACWGGTKAEAEAMRAKKAKRRIILEVVCVMWRQRIIRVRVSRGGVQRRFRQSASRRRRRQKAEAGDDRSTKAIVVALQVGRSPGSFFGTDVAWTHSTRRSLFYT